MKRCGRDSFACSMSSWLSFRDCTSRGSSLYNLRSGCDSSRRSAAVSGLCHGRTFSGRYLRVAETVPRCGISLRKKSKIKCEHGTALFFTYHVELIHSLTLLLQIYYLLISSRNPSRSLLLNLALDHLLVICVTLQSPYLPVIDGNQ
jgi:hypothetical protein